MGVASLVLGIIGLFFVLIGWIPFLGMVNYFAIFLLSIGLILGGIGMAKKNGIAIAGFIISLIFIILSSYRLYLGGGII